MSDIKEKIERLIDHGKLNQKQVGLFSLHFELYDAAKILHNAGIFPDAVVQPYEGNEMYQMGIPVRSLKAFSSDQSETVILIRMADYLQHRRLLSQYGYVINQNLYVDCEIKSLFFRIRLQWGDFWAKARNLKSRCVGTYHALRKYIHCFYDQFCGYRIYRNLRKNYPRERIYVYDYTGMGDVYVFCLYLNACSLQIAPEGMAVTVIGNVSKRVADMFQIPNIVKLTRKDSAKLTHLARLMGERLNLYPMTPFPSHLHTDIYSHYLFGKQINMADAYRCVMFDLETDEKAYPELPSQADNVEQLFTEHQLQPGNTVIISPYANTIIGYAPDFWERVTDKLKQWGFTVCTNCSGKEKALPGTVRLSFPLEIAQEVLDYAGYFVGLRSGFCDIICNSAAFKCVLYPDYPIFNSNVYAFCSFEQMRIGRNYKEICWDYQDLPILADLTVKSVQHAAVYRNAMREKEKHYG